MQTSAVVNKKIETYPCLKEYTYSTDHFIVLFTCPKKGIVVHNFRQDDHVHPIGHCSSGWAEDGFDYYEGEVKLSN